MMTLAQFYATHRAANAIVIPGRVSRLFAKRRPAAGIVLTPDAITPDQSVQAAQLLRRLRAGVLRGKKN